MGDLVTSLVNKIMREMAPFAAPEGQKRENFIKLRDGYDTGVWRDVNVALIPAALRSIARLAQRFGHKIFGGDWNELSSRPERYAQIWEDHTLEFFRVDIPVKVARKDSTILQGRVTFMTGHLIVNRWMLTSPTMLWPWMVTTALIWFRS
jgi:hypothetical protein